MEIKVKGARGKVLAFTTEYSVVTDWSSADAEWKKLLKKFGSTHPIVCFSNLEDDTFTVNSCSDCASLNGLVIDPKAFKGTYLVSLLIPKTEISKTMRNEIRRSFIAKASKDDKADPIHVSEAAKAVAGSWSKVFCLIADAAIADRKKKLAMAGKIKAKAEDETKAKPEKKSNKTESKAEMPENKKENNMIKKENTVNTKEEQATVKPEQTEAETKVKQPETKAEGYEVHLDTPLGEVKLQFNDSGDLIKILDGLIKLGSSLADQIQTRVEANEQSEACTGKCNGCCGCADDSECEGDGEFIDTSKLEYANGGLEECEECPCSECGVICGTCDKSPCYDYDGGDELENSCENTDCEDAACEDCAREEYLEGMNDGILGAFMIAKALNERGIDLNDVNIVVRPYSEDYGFDNIEVYTSSSPKVNYNVRINLDDVARVSNNIDEKVVNDDKWKNRGINLELDIK